MKFMSVFDAFARAFRRNVSKFNTKSPTNLNEKILWRMKFDRNPALVEFSDKLTVRDKVEAIGFGSTLTNLVSVYSDISEFEFSQLENREFVLKPAHGSSGILICSCGKLATKELSLGEIDDPWKIYLARPEQLDENVLKTLIALWLSSDYSRRKYVSHEWAYGPTQRRVYAEELLNSGKEIPYDYKFFVFHGTCKLIQVDVDRFGKHLRKFYNEDWEEVLLTCIYPRLKKQLPRPSCLSGMIELSEKLASEIDFLRVDLYEVDGEIKFGETTVYPGGGVDYFYPTNLNRYYGSLWSQNSVLSDRSK
jgi:hypothetical protein